MKIRKNILIFLFCPLLFACISTQQHQPDQNVTVKQTVIDHYALSLANGLQLTAAGNTEERMDIDLYTLRNNENKILANLYLGNAPDTSLQKRHLFIFNSFKTKDFTGVKKITACANYKCGEILMNLNNKNGWPQFAHIFFRNVTDHELLTIQHSIESLAHHTE